jgi:hypothetical protein
LETLIHGEINKTEIKENYDTYCQNINHLGRDGGIGRRDNGDDRLPELQW